MVVAARGIALSRMLYLLAGLIFAGNLFAALAFDYWSMLAARFIAGLPHGAYFGVGAIVATSLAAPGQASRDVCLMVTGMTIANLVGVPSFTFVCHVLSWRLPFGLVALFGAFTFAAIKWWVPVLAPLPDTGLKGQFGFLSKPAPWLIYAGVFFGQASIYCWLSYIEPIMTKVAGFSDAAMTGIMVLVGAGMVFGNLCAGKLSDRHSPALVTAVIATLIVVLMPMVYLFAADRIPSLLFAFIAPGLLFGLGGPLQYLIVRHAKGGEMLGGAGIQIAFNVSNAFAAAMGGTVIKHGFGLAAPALAGIPCAVVGATALYLLYGLEKRSGN